MATKIIPNELRTTFKQEWNTRYQASKGPWQDTTKNGSDFCKLESRNPKRNSRLLDLMKEGNTNKWDCSRLFYAIRHFDGLGSGAGPKSLLHTRVDDLREFRNEVFAHPPDAELTDADFKDSICKVRTALNDLSLRTDDLDKIKNQTSFPTKELHDVLQELDKEKMLNKEPVSFFVLPSKPSHNTFHRLSEVDQIMQEMRRLKNAANNEVTVVYLSGNPGCGKSQVARQIGEKVYNDATDETFVFTLNASNEDLLLQSYLELASRLRCDESSIAMINTTKDLSNGEKLAKVKNLATPRIEKYSSWMMILDNVSKLNSVMQHLPQAGDKTFGEGQILVTTQDSQYIPVHSHIYHLSLSSGMKPEDAVAALTEISGLSKTEEESQLSVAKALDFQPLALACAALYMQRIRHSKPSWKKYLQKLKEGERKKTERVYVEASQTYPSTMTQAVALAVANAAEQKVMMHTLHFLSVIAPEPIPLSYVVHYVKGCMPDEDEDLLYSTIRSSSLILCGDDGSKDIRIHQVIHNQLQAQYPLSRKDTKEDILSRSIVSFTNLDININETSATDIHRTRIFAKHFAILAEQLQENLEIYKNNEIISVLQTFDDLTSSLTTMSHICSLHGMYSISKVFIKLVLAMEESVYDEKHPELAITLGNLGLILQDLGQYEEAKTCLERALAIQETVYDEKHPWLATTLGNLGLILRDLGQYEEAKTCLERALAIEETVYDEKHPSLATTLGNLGYILQDLRQYEEAKTCLERALAIKETVYDEKHPSLATTLGNLGLILRNLGQYEEAKTCLERALAIQETVYDEKHPSLATTLGNLGLILRDLRQYEEAKTCLERALAIQETVYDEKHPSLATTLGNLGLILQDLGQYEEAKTCLERALAIQETVYDEKHPSLAITLGNLGLILRDFGQYEKAKTCLERALAIEETVYDEKHPSLATTLGNLGLILKDLGQYEETKTCLERTLAIQETVYDEKHPSLATTLGNLGLILRDLRQYEEAKTCLERALAIQETVYDERHPSLATTLGNLGLILQDLGQYEEAKTCLERALAIDETVYDEKHPSLATTLGNLGLILRDLGQYEDAKTCLERALAIQETVYDEKHPSLATTLGNLGIIFKDLGQYEKAKTCLERALAIDETVYDEKHPSLATTLGNLGLILQDLGQYEKAKTCLERALAIEETVYDEKHPSLVTTLVHLGLILQDLGQYEKAKTCLERALAIK